MQKVLESESTLSDDCSYIFRQKKNIKSKTDGDCWFETHQRNVQQKRHCYYFQPVLLLHKNTNAFADYLAVFMFCFLFNLYLTTTPSSSFLFLLLSFYVSFQHFKFFPVLITLIMLNVWLFLWSVQTHTLWNRTSR